MSEGVLRLPDGQMVRLDSADLERVRVQRWFRGPRGHVYRSQDGDLVALHRELLGAQVGQAVVHENGDPLDCRRANLRLVARCDAAGRRKKRRVRGVEFKITLPEDAATELRAESARRGLSMSELVLEAFQSRVFLVRVHETHIVPMSTIGSTGPPDPLRR